MPFEKPAGFDPSVELHYEESDNKKQKTYERRIAHEIAKSFGIQAVQRSILERQANAHTADVDGFSPEWLSDHVNCPIMFHAIRDYHLEQGASSYFPQPNSLLNRKGRRGEAWSASWDKLWADHRAAYPDCFLAVCFRPKWAEHTVVIHNYVSILQSTKVRGWMLYHRWETGETFVHYLKDLLVHLGEHWKPALPS